MHEGAGPRRGVGLGVGGAGGAQDLKAAEDSSCQRLYPAHVSRRPRAAGRRGGGGGSTKASAEPGERGRAPQSGFPSPEPRRGALLPSDAPALADSLPASREAWNRMFFRADRVPSSVLAGARHAPQGTESPQPQPVPTRGPSEMVGSACSPAQKASRAQEVSWGPGRPTRPPLDGAELGCSRPQCGATLPAPWTHTHA
ncbi:hypothetical protein J1605_011805 [Eschrichtius robustus]|uniref:Uncharacterized protein n=1 Tax=Eschrichtius robustus TaxID=9764 RepID=A0AB34GMF5_ESCRO|nr:hypothetical protein J1605_011805 [Eschrichtius robustus]